MHLFDPTPYTKELELPSPTRDVLPLTDYDRIIISMSGGKDSLACAIWLKQQGIDMGKVEFWHQSVDGMGADRQPYFDWPFTEGYNRALAQEFGVRLAWQWRAGGLRQEMYKENAKSGNEWHQYDDGVPVEFMSKTKPKTRRKFPAKSARDMNARWCSWMAKIGPCAKALRYVFPSDQEMKILFVTGERREESANRAGYKKAEAHRTDTLLRRVDHYRPVIDMTEKEVWRLLESEGILPAPSYYLGFPRLSCRCCIFFRQDHWATLNVVDPSVIELIRATEEEFDFTIDNKLSVLEMVQMGNSLLTEEAVPYIHKAVSEWKGSVRTSDWKLPAGAFGEGGGSL